MVRRDPVVIPSLEMVVDTFLPEEFWDPGELDRRVAQYRDEMQGEHGLDTRDAQQMDAYANGMIAAMAATSRMCLAGDPCDASVHTWYGHIAPAFAPTASVLLEVLRSNDLAG